jgi:hypothetical protein
MFLRKKLEERDIKSSTAGFGVLDLRISLQRKDLCSVVIAYNWGKLEMITD